MEWLSTRSHGMLFWEMACGKTATVALAVASLDRVLVVCPVAVGTTWPRQFALVGDDRPVTLAVSGSTARRSAAVKASPDRCLVVVNYDAIWRGELGKAIASKKWDAIVLDESHRIKSHAGRASRFLAKLGQSQPRAKRICLTGTPTPKTPLDWFAQLRFLDPEILGCSFPAFRSRIANVHPKYPGWVTGFRAEGLDALKSRIDEHVHKIKTEDILSLPEAIHTVIDVEMTPVGREIYDAIQDDMVAYLDGEPVTAANRLVVVGKLRTAASGFLRTDNSNEFTLIDGTPPKALVLEDWLEDFPRVEPLVVFCASFATARRSRLSVAGLAEQSRCCEVGSMSLISGRQAIQR